MTSKVSDAAMELPKDEWIARCMKRYIERAALDESTARDAAEACYEARDDGDTPEFAADEDMSCWSDD